MYRESRYLVQKLEQYREKQMLAKLKYAKTPWNMSMYLTLFTFDKEIKLGKTNDMNA